MTGQHKPHMKTRSYKQICSLARFKWSLGDPISYQIRWFI